jgi:hypothetical protein
MLFRATSSRLLDGVQISRIPIRPAHKLQHSARKIRCKRAATQSGRSSENGMSDRVAHAGMSA